jgi:hypothetical protein
MPVVVPTTFHAGVVSLGLAGTPTATHGLTSVAAVAAVPGLGLGLGTAAALNRTSTCPAALVVTSALPAAAAAASSTALVLGTAAVPGKNPPPVPLHSGVAAFVTAHDGNSVIDAMLCWWWFIYHNYPTDYLGMRKKLGQEKWVQTTHVIARADLSHGGKNRRTNLA